MIEELKPIAIQELKALLEPKIWTFKSFIEDLPTEEPIQGQLSVEHQGQTLFVKGEIEAIVTMTCDRCLRDFTQKLFCDEEELIWIGQDVPNKTGLKDNNPGPYSEHLNPLGKFDPQRWCFEQIHLQIPVVKICKNSCIIKNHSEEYENFPGSNIDENQKRSNSFDPRWSELNKLLKP